MISKTIKYAIGEPEVEKNKFFAKATGVKRCPRQGEWYLSGAIIEAYQAKSDMQTAYYIAEIFHIL